MLCIARTLDRARATGEGEEGLNLVLDPGHRSAM
jgi:hypothetical protein